MFDNKYPYTDFHELNLDWFMGEFKKLVAEWEETKGEWNSLHDYVQNYFENLNVQTEINNKINAMILDGTFADIVSPFITAALPALVAGQLPDVVAAQISSVVAAQISAVVADQLPAVAAAAAAAEVSDWLAAHIDPDTGYVIDKSLTVSDAAADAKTVGDAISVLDGALISNIDGLSIFNGIAPSVISSGWRLNTTDDGLCSSDSDYQLKKYNVVAGQLIKIISDDSFQFQNSASVPMTAPSNRVGNTYRNGTFYIAVPTGASYLIISTPISDSTADVFDIVPITGKLNKEISYTGIDLFDKSRVTKNLAYLESGATTAASGLEISGKIRIDPSDTLIYFGVKSTTWGHCHFWDSHGVVISGTNFKAKLGYNIITIPANAYWISFTITMESEDSFSLLIPGKIKEIEDAMITIGTGSDETNLKNVVKNSTCNFIFFSDVHGSEINVKRILDVANSNDLPDVDLVINGGDTVFQYLADGYSWYNDLVDTSTVDVLTCIGNHDMWGNALYDKVPSTTIYNAFIAPMVAKFSGIVQPVDASTNGDCYYYKDYDAVRIIVLNAMSGSENVNYWDASAATWLTNTLIDAKNNNKHVIIISHGPFTESDRVIDTNSEWTTYAPVFDSMVLNNNAVNIVQNFINENGIFIGWLAGHAHRDYVMFNNNGQFMHAIATAHFPNSYFHTDGWGENDQDSYTYDCFDYCGIDTNTKVLKIARIGWNTDASLRKRTVLSYDYGNKNILTDR